VITGDDEDQPFPGKPENIIDASSLTRPLLPPSDVNK
jgi:hypothetical protein